MKLAHAVWLAVAAVVLLPFAVPGTYYQYLGIIVFIYGIVAVGLNILAGYAGQFSLGHAALMAMGAYTSALLSKTMAALPICALSGLHVWLGMAAGTAVAALFGALLAFAALRVRGPYLAMVTIAFGWVIYKILQEWVSLTGGDLGISSIPKMQIGVWRLETAQVYYVILGLFIVALVLQNRLIRSAFGRQIRAMKHNEIGAASVGINIFRHKVLIFVISAAFAGFGGSLFAHEQNYISPDNFQFFSSVFFLLAILFGGAGTQAGPVIGAAVLTIMPELLHDFDQFRLIVYGMFILTVLYLLPNGVMGIGRGKHRTKMPVGSAAPAGGTLAVMSGGISLELDKVSRSFGGLRALRDVSLRVEPGTIHALIGPNGAGKTTLVNLISGFYRPDAGRIRLAGKLVELPSLSSASRQGVARTFQTPKLFGDMSVLDHILVGLSAPRPRRHAKRSGKQTATNSEAACGLLAFIGLPGCADVPASALPYGHQRLLEIARALAVRPSLLLLDEPAAGLAAAEIEALAVIIRRLKATGMTIVLIEHQMDLVTRVSDRITVLDQGTVIAEGTPAEIQHNQTVIRAYLGRRYAAA